jgi:predicted RNA polymerase sigma factor
MGALAMEEVAQVFDRKPMAALLRELRGLGASEEALGEMEGR